MLSSVATCLQGLFTKKSRLHDEAIHIVHAAVDFNFRRFCTKYLPLKYCSECTGTPGYFGSPTSLGAGNETSSLGFSPVFAVIVCKVDCSVWASVYRETSHEGLRLYLNAAILLSNFTTPHSIDGRGIYGKCIYAMATNGRMQNDYNSNSAENPEALPLLPNLSYFSKPLSSKRTLVSLHTAGAFLHQQPPRKAHNFPSQSLTMGLHIPKRGIVQFPHTI